MVFAKEHGCDDPIDTRRRLNALRDEHIRQQTGVKMSVLEPSACVTQPDAVGVVLLTPLMERVHTRVPEAGLINFVDSTFNCAQEEGCQVYLVYCPSKCGGLPLGAIITTCKSQEYLTALWVEYKKLLPADAFGGRGPDVGPHVFMTDDEDALRASLAEVRTCFCNVATCTLTNRKQQQVWIAAALLLCIFHVLQACWDKIHDKDTGLSTPERRAEAIGEIRAIVYMKAEGTPVEISLTVGRKIKVNATAENEGK